MLTHDKRQYSLLSSTVVMLELTPKAAAKGLKPTSVTWKSPVLCVSNHDQRPHSTRILETSPRVLPPRYVKHSHVRVRITVVMLELERKAVAKGLKPTSVTLTRPVFACVSTINTIGVPTQHAS